MKSVRVVYEEKTDEQNVYYGDEFIVGWKGERVPKEHVPVVNQMLKHALNYGKKIRSREFTKLLNNE